LSQFRSHAYNFNINVVRSEEMRLSEETPRVKRTSTGR
jgi:hypothetical protein